MLEIIKLKITSKEQNITLIEEADLIVNPGEIVLLEGVNGSGKSTILNSIMHNPIYSIEQGKVMLDGEDITDLEAFEIARRGVYLSMQHSPEIEGVSTIKMLYKAHKFVSTDSTLTITDFKKSLESKCELFALDSSMLMRDVNVGFSGGEKKQVELMHMLALEPKLILLDEPDSGVDRDAVNKVYDVINYFREKGSAILITSHNDKIRDLNISRIYKISDKKINP